MFQGVTEEKSKLISLAAMFVSLLVLGAGLAMHSRRGVEPLRFYNADLGSIRFEVLTDTLFRFEIDAPGPRRAPEIESSPMVVQHEFAGPTQFKKTGEGFSTASVEVDVTETPFCFSVRDLVRGVKLAQICPRIPGDPELLVSTSATHVYGLGEQFILGDDPLNWLHKKRTTGNVYGNKMVPFEKGSAGNAQFPVAYALGEGAMNFALFVDNIFAQTWDLSASPWSIRLAQGDRRGYFFAGENLPSLRKQYLNLVGKPLVPPRQTPNSP